MALNLKMFDSIGSVTLVSPPSMMQGREIGFTLVNLQEKEKNHFATEVNKVFPNDNVVMYMHNGVGEKGWLFKAISESKHVVMNRTNVPAWIEEMVPERKQHFIDADQTIGSIFETIKQKSVLNG
jgi:hypothetical protein